VSAFLRIAPDNDVDERFILDQPVHYFGRGQAVTELTPDDFRGHRLRFGERPAGTPALIDALEEAALTGRGGAHVLSALKWRTVRSVTDPLGPVVVANGAEGEPGSRKDAALLELRPHLVLDGLACAAEALGATERIVWLHEGAAAARRALERALAEREKLDEPPARIVCGPDRYLTGESSSVVQALSGGPALPRFQRQPSAVSGVNGRPTLVQNVETLAQVALVARGLQPSASLVTVVAGDARVVLEAPPNASLRQVVRRVTGIAPSAVLIGGYGGSWRSWDSLAKLTFGDLLTGRALGAGVLIALPADECGLARTAEITSYLAEQSARQCGPCQFGLPAVATSMAVLVRGGRRSRRSLRELDGFLAEIRGRGACGHPDGAVRMVASALSVFAPDVEAHRRGRCEARARAR
jgi:NADH:ubiquinone oxidoreductase subunit F (NADH-binding)